MASLLGWACLPPVAAWLPALLVFCFRSGLVPWRRLLVLPFGAALLLGLWHLFIYMIEGILAEIVMLRLVYLPFARTRERGKERGRKKEKERMERQSEGEEG